MKKTTAIWLMITLSIFIASCSVKIEDYQQTSPRFDIKQFFNGDLIAWGIVQDYRNHVSRRFCVELNGSWLGEQGLLAEKFYFADGKISYRNWQLTKQASGMYSGNAEDVIGEAVGKQVGMAFHWQYTLALALDNNHYQVTMDDWMYQIDKYRVFNKTAMKKFGVKVADITIFFDKSSQTPSCQIASETI